MKKKNNQTQESKLRFDLDTCLRRKDLTAAITLYESAISQDLRLSYHHFNSLLYLCSIPETLNSQKSVAVEYGFRVFDQMLSNNITPTEATITQMARLAVAKEDPTYAFELVKNMKNYGIVPRLRTYDPALYCYCDKVMADEAYAVEEHAEDMGVKLEEPEISALVKVSAEARRGEKVYKYLQKLRGTVSSVSEETAGVVERWFSSEAAAEVGGGEWDAGHVREQRERNGGGWHGLGWLGHGRWAVKRVRIGENGACFGCEEELVGADIHCCETEKFAQSVAALAMEREVKSNFKTFMDWIEHHPHYEAIIDGANIGLYKQNFAEGGFSITQLEAVVSELYNRSKNWPLIVLHNKHIRALQGNPVDRKLLEDWRAQGALYSTPSGSYDDWYWLYAAVRLKCLLITNDEMRDHIFELIGSSFFLRWKERHQVHYTFLKGLLKLQMPPIYSINIQESENGSWHVPISIEDSDESSRSWLCITRANPFKVSRVIPVTVDPSKDQVLESSCNGSSSMKSKRKERSPSPSYLHKLQH
ncbi:hypothetical protein Nepgr_009162 [Nepenthes gracilis]|uniref:ribonuclease P n=1 Tax=Nepenthes gracilis TaxID=150966 RepID=A0AAD3SAY1_NEPGR|nr:hypothetical protein Nepgr_009162 [Nepenthes gracilis]